MINDLAGVLAVFLSLGIPIVAIISGIVMGIKKKNRETELRKFIIENNVDAERVKLLVEEPEKKSNKFVMLRWGCILTFGGLATLVYYFIRLNVDPSDMLFWFFLALGMGIGMLVSFLIEMRMTKKEKESEEEIIENGKLLKPIRGDSA
ncbi:MAG: hypothetical protein IJV52_01980 [Prevotella sp.]|nr:hypothetical protein [Prevotella sp.]